MKKPSKGKLFIIYARILELCGDVIAEKYCCKYDTLLCGRIIIKQQDTTYHQQVLGRDNFCLNSDVHRQNFF